MTRLLALALVLSLASCKGKAGKTEIESESPEAQAAAQAAAERAKKLEEEKKEKAKKESKEALETAVAGFRGASSSSSEERLAAYRKLVAAMESAGYFIDVAPYAKYRPPRVKEIMARLDVLTTEEKEEAAGAPDIPEKPVLDTPKYEGAFKLAGIATQYKDGVVIRSRGKYYAVMGASCVLASCWMYVEPLGKTIFLSDIGRDGRDAEVMQIVDRETMLDDKRAHRQAVKDAAAAYKEQLAAYNKAVAENRDAVRTLEQNRAKRKAERGRLLRELDGLLVSLAKGSGEPAAAVAVEELPKEQAVAARAPAVPAVAPAGRPAQAAPAAAAQPAPTPPKPKSNRGACLRQCIATCAGDSNCERTCVATKCR